MWVDFTRDDLLTLKNEVIGTMNQIEKSIRRLELISNQPKESHEVRQELFPAQPTYGCNLCSFLPVCEEGSAKYGPKKKGEGGTRKSKVPSILPGSGVRELSLDDD